MKIQINLYDHREIDKVIIKNLGLDKTTNVNSLVKDLLYKLALNANTLQPEVKLKPHTVIHEQTETCQDKHKTSNKNVLLNSAKSLNIY